MLTQYVIPAVVLTLIIGVLVLTGSEAFDKEIKFQDKVYSQER